MDYRERMQAHVACATETAALRRGSMQSDPTTEQLHERPGGRLDDSKVQHPDQMSGQQDARVKRPKSRKDVQDLEAALNTQPGSNSTLKGKGDD